MIRRRHSRIVATLGPASRKRVAELARAGVDVFRLNFSHGSHADHAANLKAVRAAEAEVERPIGVLADLQGPKFRLGEFAGDKVAIKVGATFTLDVDPAPGTSERVRLPHPELFRAMRPGAALLLDDGKVRLEVVECGAEFARTRVFAGTSLASGKGVALPGAVIPVSALTRKDRKDLAFALRLGVDWVALSFVQRAADMAELRKEVDGRAAILAKIEKPAALDDLEAILDHCDGVMVARGDLGVELAVEDVPVAQKTILRAAHRRGVPAIVATQVLESMISSPTPTRAEASDVANAVYEGADALMLSAESAVGDYPLEAVTVMSRIIERIERDPRWPELMDAEHGGVEDFDADAITAAARRAADAQSTACLVAFTFSGGTARRMAKERPLQPVLALTPNIGTARRLTLVWGLEPRVEADATSLEDVTDKGVAAAVRYGLADKGRRVLVLAGVPFGAPGTANFLRVAHAPF